MEIRFLYFKGCPNAEPTLRLLKEVLKEKGIKDEIEIVEVKSEEEARKHHFLGSPSTQINGLDIEKERRSALSFLDAEFIKPRMDTVGLHQKILLLRR